MRFKPEQSIRRKLALAFIVVAGVFAASIGAGIAIDLEATERAARLEAEHVAELIADAATENNGSTLRLQDYVARLNSIRKRDIVIVDATKNGLADADPEEVGMHYDHDPDNEVGKTISDGKTRFFIEKNAHHPDGAYQIVVPLRQSGRPDPIKPAVGAVIVEYTSIRDELFAVEREEMYRIAAAGITIVLLVGFLGVSFAKRIAQPLQDLTSSVERLAAEDYGTRVVVTSHAWKINSVKPSREMNSSSTTSPR